MRKLKKAIFTLVVFILTFSLAAFSGCVASITCISHVDENRDGKCDHCKQKVKVEEETNVEKITMKTLPNKTYYALNDTVLDLTGGVITVTYNDGTPEADLPLDAEGVSVTTPSMVSEGKKGVSVTYGGKRTSFTIEVGVAKFVVSFDLCYEGGTSIQSQDVMINSYASAPEEPVRDGYDFIGWYTTKEYGVLFDFAMTPITENTTVYAKWAQKFIVTYAANYTGGEDIEDYTTNGKADSTKRPADRTGYNFAGWYKDAACSEPFSFDTEITGDTTVYAKWVSDNVQMYTVTFDHNYGETHETSETRVAEGATVAMPATPTRDSVSTKGHQASDFVFGGWYTDAECKNQYDFSEAVTANITLYAKWTGTYIFEAEHVSFIDPSTGLPMQGMGASGGSVGANMVDSPAPGMEGINASNGYYVTYLYSPGLTLSFIIESDRDVSDATLIFRISAESAPYAITPTGDDGVTDNGTKLSQYIIMLNDVAINYETIEILDVSGHTSTGNRRPFSDFTIAVNLSLKKGQNVFSFITANTNGMGGTMAATAPVIDCIKVQTSAELSWDPITSNEFGQ